MALTITVRRRTVQGNRRIVYADVTFDSSYATGGVALTPQNLGLSTIDELDTGPVTKSDNSRACPSTYDYTNQKLLVWGTAAGATGLTEIANATDLSAYSVRLKAEGN